MKDSFKMEIDVHNFKKILIPVLPVITLSGLPGQPGPQFPQ